MVTVRSVFIHHHCYHTPRPRIIYLVHINHRVWNGLRIMFDEFHNIIPNRTVFPQTSRRRVDFFLNVEHPEHIEVLKSPKLSS